MNYTIVIYSECLGQSHAASGIQGPNQSFLCENILRCLRLSCYLLGFCMISFPIRYFVPYFPLDPNPLLLQKPPITQRQCYNRETSLTPNFHLLLIAISLTTPLMDASHLIRGEPSFLKTGKLLPYSTPTSPAQHNPKCPLLFLSLILAMEAPLTHSGNSS